MYDTKGMVTKRDRQAAVRRLIEQEPVRTQADLRAALATAGVRVDQSTLSRDLAELNVRKAGGRYTFAAAPTNGRLGIDVTAAVIAVDACGPHLIVVRTGVGQAQPVAIFIDEQTESSITGTLAGDDTLFLATKSRRSQAVALRRLAQWFGEHHEQ